LERGSGVKNVHKNTEMRKTLPLLPMRKIAHALRRAAETCCSCCKREGATSVM
jgi:hypothetical protein